MVGAFKTPTGQTLPEPTREGSLQLAISGGALVYRLIGVTLVTVQVPAFVLCNPVRSAGGLDVPAT